ncbi:methionine-synthesizing 5- methyltetrahydropteroyltriglutamate--homocysteine methyltransferase [Rhizophlyctis rosea]|uniref:5-methyltetrahydropteroyltriglutamate--homocysteine S-methyltransferase n=1 Tax=Rhizophlyctis rosea TaxID=64517 RepID=A0AAD5SLA8_9FUNG|nr:methionine-synthesizing 5- methyltetrahydropteroyltriglutamate--homocysteine methyltransferase [Rhizophlyctis rosea]
MVTASNLGFPRIGGNRELKKLVENYWNGKLDEKALLTGAKNLRAEHWKLQAEAGIAQGHIPSNDFSFYDQVLDHLLLFGVIPARYANLQFPLETYFAMGRGLQKPEQGIDVPAMEMKKWFDTNYHFIVPKFEANQEFTLRSTKPIDEYKEAKALGIQTRPVILGPISLLHLGKAAKGASFDPITLLDKLLPAYASLLTQLAEAGAEWVQFDEPVLSFDLPLAYKAYYAKAYQYLASAAPGLKILLANYFGRIGSNLDFITPLPIAALHVDLVRAPEELDIVLQTVSNSAQFALSLGVINGRNIWKADLDAAIAKVNKVAGVLGNDRVFVAPSCSLLHTPHSLTAEVKMKSEIRDWLAFSVEKLHEIVAIAKAVREGEASVADTLAANRQSIQNRRTSNLIHNPAVKAALAAVTEDMFRRKSPFPKRYADQQTKLQLPAFPTTTVGSFPQTKEVRVARQKLKKGEYTAEEYDAFIKKEIDSCIKFQEEVGLDVLVHGEFERNDMVEYFGECLQGYVFSQNGWVQSYGSRCVKPPIIYGDVSRPNPMTVYWSQYAQTKTKLPMKGMLTGPVTCLQWSFVRDDQPRKDTTFQLALAIRQEVVDLEKAGIPVIQIDEPAIREGLPLRHSDWAPYLDWAAKAFLLSSTGVEDSTQIHTHMCYSDFNDIFPTIQALDADVITIENSKSDLKLLSAFESYGYTNGIGPGLYDIHSPRVPSEGEMKERLDQMLQYLKKELVWVNPDCGLKTRGWKETEEALKNMCEVAKAKRVKSA